MIPGFKWLQIPEPKGVNDLGSQSIYTILGSKQHMVYGPDLGFFWFLRKIPAKGALGLDRTAPEPPQRTSIKGLMVYMSWYMLSALLRTRGTFLPPGRATLQDVFRTRDRWKSQGCLLTWWPLICRSLKSYQHHFEVYLRYLITYRYIRKYLKYSSVALVIIHAPTVPHHF